MPPDNNFRIRFLEQKDNLNPTCNAISIVFIFSDNFLYNIDLRDVKTCSSTLKLKITKHYNLVEYYNYLPILRA